MKKNKLKLGVFILLLSVLNNLQAQEIVSIAGGEASGDGGSASYTIGQAVYTTHQGTDGNSIAQGVQQPVEISTVLGINETTINLKVSVYPNPTTNHLTLKTEKTEGLTVLLYDLQGKLIESKKVTTKTSTIKLEKLAAATYFLKVVKNNKPIRIFKIIKN